MKRNNEIYFENRKHGKKEVKSSSQLERLENTTEFLEILEAMKAIFVDTMRDMHQISDSSMEHAELNE
ncbi:unnamed protein product [Litomosoides sigmodontis]|uniref:Uncharacterized protein n=1 Tax=Litomosoides sigmodontis TaxID=42156 RepID=A0A3P6RZ45_LITSI|nr:unnamed protein product [Litomosoides sigmodontis]